MTRGVPNTAVLAVVCLGFSQLNGGASSEWEWYWIILGILFGIAFVLEQRP